MGKYKVVKLVELLFGKNGGGERIKSNEQSAPTVYKRVK